jgi:hypothetical protein
LKYVYEEAADRANASYDDANGTISPIAQGNEMFGNEMIRGFYSGGDAAQAAGASTPGGTDIAAADSASFGWGSSLDSTQHDTGTMAFGTASSFNVDGSLRGGSGSFIEGSGGRKVSLELVGQAVSARTRKLQASWTPEAHMDAKSQHGINIESEMLSAMSARIIQDIDAEIISDLVSLAGTTATWDYAPTGGPLYAPAYIGDRFANVGAVINRVANEIGRKTRIASGNYIVVSPMMVSVLQTASKSVFAPAVDGSFKGPNDSMLVGTLNGNIKVYSYLWNKNQPSAAAGVDTILVGLKGTDGETSVGYIYAPYQPVSSSGVVINPTTFQPVVSLMTRYGKFAPTDASISLGNGADFYGKISVDNLVFN